MTALPGQRCKYWDGEEEEGRAKVRRKLAVVEGRGGNDAGSYVCLAVGENTKMPH